MKTRDWHAVNAHFRRSGPMKGRKKEQNKSACRDYNEDYFCDTTDLDSKLLCSVEVCPMHERNTTWSGIFSSK